MKTISSIVAKVAATPAAYSSQVARAETQRAQREQAISEDSARVINALFKELKAIHPAWQHAWPTKEIENLTKISWTKAFTAERINTIEQIRHGIAMCRKNNSPFMPSSGQFIDWCRPSPEDLGLPSVDRAYLLACVASHPNSYRDQLHPAVHHAACETGYYALANLPESKSRPMFERAYQITVEMVLKGEPLREIPLALPSTPTKPKNLPAGNAALNLLKRRVTSQ